MTFYLKHRPQTIQELDLKTVRESLKKLVASGRIPHAFLFSGPKGIGKTSAARILAKVINCESKRKLGKPCNKCYQCRSITAGNNIDVIELDAASHRGIDDIRNLRDNIALAPSAAKKKIYIIDEVHMLTLEAANAFLKTLEEPPGHVVFILATTNPEKLPETVRSRLQTIVFQKASPNEIKRQLSRVIKREKIKVEEGVIDEIAKVADGSFRDAAKVLEQLSLVAKKITKEDCQNILLQPKALEIEVLLDLLAHRKTKKCLHKIEAIMARGGSAQEYTKALLGRLQQALLVKHELEGEDLAQFSTKEIVSLIKILLTTAQPMATSFIPQLPLEIAVIKWCQNKPGAKKVEKQSESKTEDSLPSLEDLKEVDQKLWSKILSAAKSKDTRIEALLRATRPLGCDGNILKLGVYYQFHKERLEIGQNKLILEEIITSVLGAPMRVNYILTEKEVVETKESSPLTEVADQDIIQAAKEIFGN